MADLYGTDFSTFAVLAPGGPPDLDLSLRVQGGNRVLAEDLARRLQTEPGSLFWAPEEVTVDVREWIGRDLGDRARFELVSKVRAAALADERVLTVAVTGTADVAARTLRLVLEGEGAAGPFRFVMDANEFDVNLVES